MACDCWRCLFLYENGLGATVTCVQLSVEKRVSHILQEVDVQLKAVCERFISDMTSGLTVPLKDFLAKCDVIFQLAEKDRLDPASTLLQQPFAKAGNK